MSRKQAILKGTLILTATSLVTRIMGFGYRIFLSQIFLESGVGLYQLIFPIYALGFSITSAGIELALSRSVAKYIALGEKKRARELLYTSLIISIFLSLIFTLLLQNYADVISVKYLHNKNSFELLLLLSYVFPFAAIHSCIIGYYLGFKQTKIPSISQFIEQTVRIASVFFFYFLSNRLNFHFRITFAVLGIMIGEMASSIYCINKFTGKILPVRFPRLSLTKFITHARELLTLALPITASRTFLNVLQSIEAVSIPISLESYGLSSSDALSIYGVLTGMALPCILFPSALTNSISTMLLPTVSEIQTLGERRSLITIVSKTLFFCSILGVFSCITFLVFGEFAGNILFNSILAGKFIITLAWICPFLYTNNTLLSIINGIGKTTISFFINVFSLCVRIICVIFIIPLYGIYGYLFGLLLSQVFIFAFSLLFIYHKFKAEEI